MRSSSEVSKKRNAPHKRACLFLSKVSLLLSIGGALYLALGHVAFLACPEAPARGSGNQTSYHCGPRSGTLPGALGHSLTAYVVLGIVPLMAAASMISIKRSRIIPLVTALMSAGIAYGFATWSTAGSGWWAFLPGAATLIASSLAGLLLFHRR